MGITNIILCIFLIHIPAPARQILNTTAGFVCSLCYVMLYARDGDTDNVFICWQKTNVKDNV